MTAATSASACWANLVAVSCEAEESSAILLLNSSSFSNLYESISFSASCLACFNLSFLAVFIREGRGGGEREGEGVRLQVGGGLSD